MKKRRGIINMAIAIICTLILILGCSTPAFAAGTVTDTLGVKIGYWGMDQDDYVTKKTYHWTELDDMYGGNLTTHQVPYSFYQESDDTLLGKKFNTIIDSARGFYIEDLIEYAGISLRDIQSISFYTNDKSVGYFTSFTYSELFSTQRYYFDDLSSFLTPIWKDDSEEYMEDVLLDDNAWNAKRVVKPMLALEDSWARYEAGTEHTSPDFSSMGTGNRFRLLFGQSSPQESRTNQTAKYVHTVYVTLNGKPKVTTDKIKLSSKVGSHTVTFNVAAGDEGMIDELLKELRWSSSDDTILKIKNIRMETLNQYDDAIQVTLSYEILKEGIAYINGSYLGLEVGGQTLKVGGKGSGNGSGTSKGNGSGNSGTSGNTGSSGSEKSKSSGDAGGKSGETDGDETETAETAEITEEAEEETTDNGLQEYVLNDDIAQMLAETEEGGYDQLEVEETDQSSDAMPLVGGGAAIALVAGAAGGVMDFRRRR